MNAKRRIPVGFIDKDIIAIQIEDRRQLAAEFRAAFERAKIEHGLLADVELPRLQDNIER